VNIAKVKRDGMEGKEKRKTKRRKEEFVNTYNTRLSEG
jgi:hypothetical protein